MTKKIIVIGAGVAGLGIAWRLASEGFEVEVFERDCVGAGASSVAGGMLAPTAEVRFEEVELLKLGQRSLAEWPAFAKELEAASNLSIDYRDYGTLVVAVDRDDLEYIAHMHEYQTELGLETKLLDGNGAREIEPGLAGSIPGALWSPTDHNVDPILLLKALVVAIRNAKGRITEHAEVIEIIEEKREGNQKVGIRLRKRRTVEGEDAGYDEEVVFGDVVVLAAGSWTKKLENLPADAPRVRPVKGQMLALGNYALTTPNGRRETLVKHVLRGPDAYLIPRSDGRLIIGATSEEMGWDEHQTAGGVFELLRGGWEMFPGIYDAPLLDMWTGFRPTTLDNDPVLRWSDVPGIFYATGFGRNGILLTAWSSVEGARRIMERLG